MKKVSDECLWCLWAGDRSEGSCGGVELDEDERDVVVEEDEGDQDKEGERIKEGYESEELWQWNSMRG